MTYDANGNTLSDGTNTYAWDARNRLSSANSGTASFSYDALGRRASKTLLSTTTGFLYDGPNVAQEQSGGTVTANMLSGSVDENFLRTDCTGSYAYLTDALGSTVALTDSTGTNIDQYSYSPYGMLAASGSNSNPYTYTGRESDGLGLYYYRARFYNPATGRFLNEDPLGFAGSGTNLYAYAAGNPINFNDPFGLKCGCKGPPLADNPANLSLFPTDVQKGNFYIMYRLRTANGASAPNGTWYVFEHQTQPGGGRFPVGPGNNVSPYPSDPDNDVNSFPDWLGGGNLNSIQSFTISPNRTYDPDCQSPVMINYGNGQVYGSQGIWQPVANQPYVLINGYQTLPNFQLP